jgi:amidase
MARSAADLSLGFDLLAQPDELTLGTLYQLALRPPRHDTLRGFRVLVIDSHPLAPVASCIRNGLDRLAGALTRAGAVVARASPLWPEPEDAARLYVRLLISFLSTFWAPAMQERARAQAAALSASDHSLAAERARASQLSHRDWVVADLKRAELRQRWRALFAAFDVVVCPIMPTPAFPHDHSEPQNARQIMIDGEPRPYGDQLVWAGVASCPGLPATAFPLGFDGGLPFGAQAIGPMYEDRTALRFAELVEREIGGFVAPPIA